MLDYFNADFATAKGRVINSSFISIASTVIKNHKIIRERYVSSSRSVPPTNLVYKLLSGLVLNKEMLSGNFDYIIRDRARRLATSLDVTSPSSYGTVFTDTFLNGGNEAIMFTYEKYDKEKWEDMSPITFAYHTSTNVNYQLGTSNDDTAFAFVVINVPMLAYQYLQWANWRSLNGVEENIYNFIKKYPLFNSLKSYMDISLFNRHYYRVVGNTIPEDDRVNEYPIPDIENRLNKTTVDTVNSLFGKSTTIGSALYATRLFFKDSALDLIEPIPTIYTQQVSWFLLACKMPFLHYGLSVGYSSGVSLDSKVLSTMQRELRAFINSRTLSHVPKHMKVHIIDNYLENLLILADEF